MTSATGITSVPSTAAHAWAEAYIEGIGWITFDPTPGQGARTGWKVTSQSNQGTAGNVTIAIEEDEEEEKTALNTLDKPTDNAQNKHTPHSFLFPILLTILFIALSLLLDFGFRFYQYQTKSEREKHVTGMNAASGF